MIVDDFKSIRKKLERHPEGDDKTAADCVARFANATNFRWPPIRISAEKDDPGFASYNAALARGEKVAVYLDGIEQFYCVTADAAEGFVKVYRDGFNVDVVHGKVEIKLISHEAA
jgi:hypothetical protein